MTQDQPDYDDEPKSKSQLKRDMHALQAMGKTLAELKPDQLAQLPLEPRLLEALNEYKRLKHREARRRQLQFIGRLMREADQDNLEKSLDQFDLQSRHHMLAQQQAERWRDALLTDPSALQRFIDEHPSTDIQHLRQLLRQAQKEQTAEKPANATRKLFRHLLDTIAHT